MANIARARSRAAANDTRAEKLTKPPTNVVFAPLPTQQLSAWTVEGVRRALDTHEQGFFADSAALVDAMGRDDRIKGCLGTRVKAIVGKNGIPFSILPSDNVNKARGRVTARQLTPLWWDICPDSTVATIQADVTMLGAHLSRIEWVSIGGAWLPRLRPVPAHNLYFDETPTNGPRGYYLQTLTGPIYIDPADPNWFLYTPGGERAWLSGAVRALGLPFLMRQFSHRDWVRYCEKHGMPIITVQEPMGADANATKEAFYKRLAKLGTETVIRLPTRTDGSGFKLEVIEAKDGSWQSFDSFIARLDVAVAVVLLGQNMTTDPQAMATGVTNARLVRQDYLDADVQPLSTELREQIIKPWGRYNISGWDDELAPWPTWDTRPPEDQKAKAATLTAVGEAIGKLTSQGIPLDVQAICEQFTIPVLAGKEFGAGQFTRTHFDYGIVTVNQVLERLGLEPRPDGDVPVKSQASSSAPKTPGDPNTPDGEDPAPDEAPPPADEGDRNVDHLDERALKEDGFTEGQAYADELAADGRDAGADAMAADLDVVLTAVRTAKDYADLQAKLIKAYRGMSADGLAKVTEKAMIMAELAGRYATLKDL